MAPPPWASMTGISCFMQRNTLVRLLAMIRSHWSSGYSWIDSWPSMIPALLCA